MPSTSSSLGEIKAALRSIGFADSAPDAESVAAYSRASSRCSRAIDAVLDDAEFWGSMSSASHAPVDYKLRERVVDLVVDTLSQQMTDVGYIPPPEPHELLDIAHEIVSDNMFGPTNVPTPSVDELVGTARAALRQFRRALNSYRYYPDAVEPSSTPSAIAAIRGFFGRLKWLLLGVATAGALTAGALTGADMPGFAADAAANIAGGAAVYLVTREAVDRRSTIKTD